jgi:hypothetical protein
LHISIPIVPQYAGKFRGPFLTSPLEANFDPRGEVVPQGLILYPGGEVIPYGRNSLFAPPFF